MLHQVDRGELSYYLLGMLEMSFINLTYNLDLVNDSHNKQVKNDT